MKKIFRFGAILVLIAFAFSSCEDNSTEPDSVSAYRDKFLGTWRGTSSGTGGTRNFNMKVTASNSSPDQIIIENFDGAGLGTFIAANVNVNSFTLVRTVINGETIEGGGTFNANETWNFSFTVNDGQSTDNRTGTARR